MVCLLGVIIGALKGVYLSKKFIAYIRLAIVADAGLYDSVYISTHTEKLEELIEHLKKTERSRR